DAGALETASFDGVIGRGAGAGGAFTLLSTTVACVEIGLGAPASPTLPLNCPDSGGGSGSPRFISFADPGRLATSCSSARIIASAVLTETSGASARRGGKLNGGSSCGSRPVSR